MNSHIDSIGHYGTERHERDQEKANPLVDEELRRLGWTEKGLEQRPKGDKQKVETAQMLRQQTTRTFTWIPQRRHMGSWTYVSNLLHQNQHYKVNSEDWIFPRPRHFSRIDPLPHYA